MEASLWYASKRQTLEKDFLAEIKKNLNKIAIAPESYPLYYKSIRRVMMHRFPYKLFYQVEVNRIVVLRVLHAKRDHTAFLKEPILS